VTSKLQVTLPKALAEQYRIKPGDEILWVSAGDAIRVVPAASKSHLEPVERRLALFDAATARLRARRARGRRAKKHADRGWRREDLYVRGRAR